jgi:predicted anti-sigma-YlaC factor YlaD
MFCDEALDAVEPIAAGDLNPDGRVAEHLATCPNCAAALDSAKALDTMLRRRPTPKPSPQFTTRTVARVRRAKWRSDQFLDAGFNAAIGAIVLGVVIGLWMLLNRTGLAVVGNDAVDLFASGLVTFARSIAPSVPVYLGATALLVSAIGIWWWAEQG